MGSSRLFTGSCAAARTGSGLSSGVGSSEVNSSVVSSCGVEFLRHKFFRRHLGHGFRPDAAHAGTGILQHGPCFLVTLRRLKQAVRSRGSSGSVCHHQSFSEAITPSALGQNHALPAGISGMPANPWLYRAFVPARKDRSARRRPSITSSLPACSSSKVSGRGDPLSCRRNTHWPNPRTRRGNEETGPGT